MKFETVWAKVDGVPFISPGHARELYERILRTGPGNPGAGHRAWDGDVRYTVQYRAEYADVLSWAAWAGRRGARWAAGDRT